MTRAASFRVARHAALALLLAFAAGGCSREEESDADTSSPASDQAAVPSAMDSTMPGMAHGADSAAHGAAPGSATAGMDHQQMGPGHAQGGAAAGTAPPVPGRAMPGMAGMDHARMAPGSATSPGAAAPAGAQPHAQHAGIPETQVQRGQEPATSPAAHAMAHGTVDSQLSGTDAEELLGLVRTLVQDSVVQQAIRADPALREAWEDPAVRAVIISPR